MTTAEGNWLRGLTATHFVVGLSLLVCSAPGVAGPPYVTDDPEPAELGHWEVYAFTAGVRGDGTTDGDAGLDINYGLARDLQLTVVVPLDYAAGQRLRGNLGDLELGLKYRFVKQEDGSILPDIAIFPALALPTGSTRRDAGKGGLLLPIWLQKDFGDWSWFGGGGYSLNAGRSHQNTWLFGTAVARQATKRLNVGAEIYRETAEEADELTATGMNLGAIYELSDQYALTASGGPQWTGRKMSAGFYIALEFQH